MEAAAHSNLSLLVALPKIHQFVILVVLPIGNSRSGHVSEVKYIVKFNTYFEILSGVTDDNV